MEPESRPLVNVCMICRDRWELTEQAIRSLLETTGWLEGVTLTIVNDGSKDETRSRLINWPTMDHALIVNHTNSYGVGGARNSAATETPEFHKRGRYLYFSDNDVVFKDDWLCNLIKAYEAAKPLGFRIIGGYSHPYNQTVGEPIKLETAGEGHQPWITEVWRYELHEKYAVDGLSMFMEWSTWDHYGTFCDNVTDRRSSEDHEYCQRVRKDGFRVGTIYPHAVINCGRTDTWGNEIPGADIAFADSTEILAASGHIIK